MIRHGRRVARRLRGQHARCPDQLTGRGTGCDRSRVLVVVSRTVAEAQLPGDVVAVLLRPERAPSCRTESGQLGTEDAGGRDVTVRDVDAGDLVVAVVVAGARVVV